MLSIFRTKKKFPDKLHISEWDLDHRVPDELRRRGFKEQEIDEAIAAFKGLPDAEEKN